jgi:hypothetical protein
MKNSLNTIKKYQKPAVWMLVALNVVMAGGYVYAVNRTVFNVVAVTKAESALAQNYATVADLESHQASLRNKITLDFAYSQGFKDASKQQIFITRKSLSNALTFNAL